jgi:hypothetical protein
MHHVRWVISSIAFLSLALATGCGGSEGAMPSLIPVEGMVKVGNDPLKTGSISFNPDNNKGNQSKHVGVGTITDGKFTLTTNGKVGVPAGAYKVSIVSTVSSNPKDEYAVPKSLINTKYNNADSSGLTADVKAAGEQYLFTVTK